MTNICKTFGYVHVTSVMLMAIAGCSNLSFIEPDQCGNLVVENAVGEDCDGEPGCGAPNTEHACRYVCDDPQRSCPTEKGFRCGADSVCRRPSGILDPLEARSVVATRDLLLGDVNADGCSEVVTTALRTTSVTAYASNFSESCVASEQTIATNRPDSGTTALPRPALLDLSPNDNLSYSSLLSASRSTPGDGLSLHFSNGSSTLFPVLFPRIQRQTSAIRSMTVKLWGTDTVLVLEQEAGKTKGDLTLIANPNEKITTLSAVYNGNVDDIEVVIAADIDVDFGNLPPPESRCDEIILIRKGSTYLEPFKLCTAPATIGFSSMPTVQLVGTTHREQNQVLVAGDINGDDCMDLAANANEPNLYVTYGTCNGKFQSLPGPPMPIPDQKASALNDPVAAEAVKVDRIFVAIEADSKHPGREIYPVACPSSTPFNSPKCSPVTAPCKAIVADIDRDGRDDVIATEGQNVDVIVHRQVAEGTFNVSFLSTSCPPQYLGVGDFDDDGTNDIAFFDQTSKGPEDNTTSLSVAYGNAFSAPNEPAAAGRFDQAKALAVLPSQKMDTNGAVLSIARGVGADNSLTALGFVEIANDRSALAPYYLANDGMGAKDLEPRTAISMTAGLFSLSADDNPIGALALITKTQAGENELWLVNANDTLGSLRNAGKTISSDIPCGDGCALAALPQSNGRDNLLLLGEGTLIEYTADVDGFIKTNTFTSKYSFPTMLSTANPPKYAPRPLVGDLNADSKVDVLALAATGQLVALYGKDGGGFTEEVLVKAPSCESGQTCGNMSATQINLDTDDALELVVVGPDTLAVFDIDVANKKLIDVSPAYAKLLPIPRSNTDYTAISAGDIDGDGVSDVVLASSSNFLSVLRGRPEHE